MSELNQNDLRPMRFEEDSLVRALLRHVTGGEQLLRQLARAQVRDMDDDGTGSLKFEGGEHRSIGSYLVEAEYLDRDGDSGIDSCCRGAAAAVEHDIACGLEFAGFS